MEVRLCAKIGDAEVGVGVLILDMSKLLQAIQSRSLSTPSSFSGPVSHLYSPLSVSQVPFSVEVQEQNLTSMDESIEVVAASTLPILTPSMSTTMSSESMTTIITEDI